MSKYCENCGERSYNGACTNCHEEIYIEKQYEDLNMIVPDKISMSASEQRKEIKQNENI